jgi:DNA (cytosine-5)-methyltransferase 1
VIDAADLGIPQNRERLFIVADLDREIHIQQPSKPHTAIAPHIDWNWPKWSRIADRVPATQARAARGREQHGDRFLFPYYGSTKGGRCLDRPIGTIVTKDRWAVVDGDRMRMLQIEEARVAMGFPQDYILPRSKTAAMKMLGNAVVPAVARHIIEQVKAAA